MTARERIEQKRKEKLATNEAYLAENAKKEGIITTNSGLQYRIITVGNGATPTATDVVRVHYKGCLTNGNVFDSSIERGRPAEFPVGAVIEGWQEALQLMPVGAKYELILPSNLAYGKRGSGSIKPNEILIFEVELLNIL